MSHGQTWGGGRASPWDVLGRSLGQPLQPVYVIQYSVFIPVTDLLLRTWQWACLSAPLHHPSLARGLARWFVNLERDKWAWVEALPQSGSPIKDIS